MAIGSLPPSSHSELSSPNWGGENGSVIDRDQYAARDVAPLPQRAGAVPSGLPEHKRRVTLGAGSPGIADAPELWIEVVLSHRTSLDLACWRNEIWRTRWSSRRCQTVIRSIKQISAVDGMSILKASSKM